MHNDVPVTTLGRQIMRAVIASNAGTVMDFSLLAFLVELLLIPSVPASAASFLAGTSFVYFLNVRWVFPVRRFDNRSTEFWLFLGISMAGLTLNTGSMWLCTGLFNLHYLLSKVIAGAMVFLFNFTARKMVLFSV